MPPLKRWLLCLGLNVIIRYRVKWMKFITSPEVGAAQNAGNTDVVTSLQANYLLIIHEYEITHSKKQLCVYFHDTIKTCWQARIRRFSDQRCTPIRAIVQAPDWHVNYYWIVEWIFLVVIICVWNFHYAWCIISIQWSMLESLSWKVIFNQ